MHAMKMETFTNPKFSLIQTASGPKLFGLVRAHCNNFININIIDEGVYMDGNGRMTKEIRLQWGESPTSVG